MTHTLNKALRLLSAVVALPLLVSASAPSACAQPVQVKVIEQPQGSNVIYFYRIVNNGSKPVVALRVGFDYLHGVPELATPPLGWTFDGGLPPGSASAPSGWQTRVVTTEENPFVDIEWSNEGGASGDIAPGASQSGFRVIVPQASAPYRSGHFDVILGDSTHVSAPMVPDDAPPPPTDVTPPTLSVTLNPSELWPPNHKLVTINAQISVSDDQDPNPIVRLVSITCNEPINSATDISGASFGTDDRAFAVRAERVGQRKEGRVYTVTYSATDAAGNSTTTTATVTLPHDQRH
jgi:hypothetical protein